MATARTSSSVPTRPLPSFNRKNRQPSSLPTKKTTNTKPKNQSKKPNPKNEPQTLTLTTTTPQEDVDQDPYAVPRKRMKKFVREVEYAWTIPIQRKTPRAIYRDIQRFARNERLEEALTIMDYATQLGIPINVTSLSHLISACIRRKSLPLAKRIHFFVKFNGLESNEFLNTRIVEMYASCGNVSMAKRVLFDCSNGDGRFHHVYAWNALLRGSVVSGWRNYEGLLEVFVKMRETGVELNEYSYSCLIKSLSGAGRVAFGKGLEVHALLVKNGFIGSAMLKTSLIDLYFKCGKVKLACRLFDEVSNSDRDVVLWGTMISGFAHKKMLSLAIRYLRLMLKEGIVPNSVVVSIILPAIADIKQLKLGKEVHAFVFKDGKYLEDPFIKSALVDMYCKCGDIGSGRNAFYFSKHRSAASWTALMSGYVASGRLEQALRCILWMQNDGFRPDVVSLATILPVCGELKALSKGKEIHAYLMKRGFLPNVSLCTSLMVMYSKCGLLDYGRKAFEGQDTRNVIAWTAFIDSCLKNGRPYEALELFRSMQLLKHRADAVTISRVLDICSEVKGLKLGKEVHAQALRKDFQNVPFVSSRLVGMYGKCGQVEKAKLVLELHPRPKVGILTTMIEVYGNNNCFREAIQIFDQMVQQNLPLNEVTLKVTLAVCDRAGSADEACRIFQLMTQRYKVVASREHYSIMAGLLCRLGRTSEGEKYIQLGSRLDL